MELEFSFQLVPAVVLTTVTAGTGFVEKAAVLRIDTVTGLTWRLMSKAGGPNGLEEWWMPIAEPGTNVSPAVSSGR